MTTAKQTKTQHTAFEKIEKYITKIAEDYGATIEKGQKSRYFKFNGRILRLSNHIGKNSSGAISIIIPNGKDDTYILHVHSNGSIQTLTLQQLKEFIRTFALMSDFIEPLLSSQNQQAPKPENIILGYNKSNFTEAQVNQIRLFITQNNLK